jgi:cleavage and polyadenylation specificity factor subunit 4
MKGNQCGFLHQFDKQRMPTCRFYAKYNECKEPDCPFKHSLEDVKDCNMYKLGFCIHGTNCRYRHPRSDGAPPDIHEAALFGRPGHLHGAAPRHVRQQQAQMLEMRQHQQLGNGSEPIGMGKPGGFVPPPLPPGPPPSSARRNETQLALPDGDREGDGNPFEGDPFRDPPLTGGGLPGMPGAAGDDAR